MILANPKIVLLGYMGCGKSTIGALLAQVLGLPFIDLDNYIAQHEGKSITELFLQKGEVYFRKKEKEYLEEILQRDAFVLALGGGTPCYWGNMEQIKQKTTAVYLLLSVKALTERLLPEKHNRPLIAHVSDNELSEFIHKHLFDRQAFYGQASFYINTEGKTPTEIVKLLKTKLLH